LKKELKKEILSVTEVKPQRPKKRYQLTKPLEENPLVAELKLYTSELMPGGAWQGEIVAPMAKGGAFYRVRNIWLELISYQGGAYTFRIETAFMVELPQVIYLYQQNSRIVVEEVELLKN